LKNIPESYFCVDFRSEYDPFIRPFEQVDYIIVIIPNDNAQYGDAGRADDTLS